MTRPLFSLCMPYWNNPGMLAEHYRRWSAFAPEIKARMEVVICDDASDEPAWKQEVTGLSGQRLFRILPPHVMWSQCCATNVAASKANGRWLVITDIDHIVPEETWDMLASAVGNGHLDPKRAYRFRRKEVDGTPYKQHPNSWLMTRETFEATKGHDERYRGIYNQDAAFIERVQRVCGEIQNIYPHIIRVGRETIPDASTRGAPREDIRNNKEVHAKLSGVKRRAFKQDGTYWKDTRFSAAFVEVE